MQLISLIYFENKTERECAEIYAISQKNINKKKKRILDKIAQTFKKVINFRVVKPLASTPIQV